MVIYYDPHDQARIDELSELLQFAREQGDLDLEQDLKAELNALCDQFHEKEIENYRWRNHTSQVA